MYLCKPSVWGRFTSAVFHFLHIQLLMMVKFGNPGNFLWQIGRELHAARTELVKHLL